jgi:hypothetical protein
MSKGIMSTCRALIAAIGPWTDLSALTAGLTTSFRLTLEPVDPEWREDLIQRGWDTDALEKPQLKVIRGHGSVIWAEREFEAAAEGAELSVAREAAWLLRSLAERGASALYFDAAEKVMAPEALNDFPSRDSVALLHLFVEVWGDADEVLTEGMEVFGLPDVRVVGVDPKSAEAQATAFSAAAQLVCDGLALPAGAEFRASESFPLFVSAGVSRDEAPAEADEVPPNPCGYLTLRLTPPAR